MAMTQKYVDDSGRPVNEQGQWIERDKSNWSSELKAFFDEAFAHTPVSADASREEYVRDNRLTIAALEPFRDRISDKGELEYADSLLDTLHQFGEDAQKPVPPPSEAFQQAMAAASSGFAYGPDIEANIEAVHQALVRIHEFMPMITERGERKQISGQMSSLLRQRMGLVATMSDEQRADWVSRGGLSEQSDYLAAAKLNAANVAKREQRAADGDQ